MQGLLALQRYADFSGRSARAEYWQFMGMLVLTIVVAYLLDLAFSGPYATPTFTIIAWLALVIPGYAVSARRLHDRGRTGWWMAVSAGLSAAALLLMMAATQAQYTTLGDVLLNVSRVPSVVNLAISIFLLIQFLKRGDENGNQYGPDPLDNPAPAPRVADFVAKAQEAAGNVNPRSEQQSRRPTDGDPIEQIERLAKLRDAGLLTEAEFSEQKAAYLSRL